MEMIKEYCEVSNRCVIRTANPMARSMALLRKLATQAIADSPGKISFEDMEPVIYAGNNMGILGIEFDLPAGAEVPPDYVDILRLEPRY